MGKERGKMACEVKLLDVNDKQTRDAESNDQPVTSTSGKDDKMADKKQFGFEQTLIYGRYTKDLGNFAKFQAKVTKSADKKDFGSAQPRKKNRLWIYYGYLRKGRDWIFAKIGEDWIFLALLGIINALLSFMIDFVISKLQQPKFWFYEELSYSVGLQYICWALYSVLLIMFATGFTHLVAPQAGGSGIPEMKTILRGVVLKEYFTFKTLISKVVGLCCALGSTLPIGRLGPFVHIASIVANSLSKLSTFKGIYANETRRSEMLAAACAVGVAGTFGAPIGGVLFSIEVTATYFAVRNYWRGFFGAVCGAVMFRLLAFWFKYEETLTAMFQTNFKSDFPFDPVELLAFSFIGIACGFGGALFIFLHRKIVLFTRKHKQMSAFLQKNRFIYPGFVALVISSVTFPHGLGQYYAGSLTNRRALHELFSNITWTNGQADDLEDEEILAHWNPPNSNMYVTLTLFIIMNFWMGAICNTLPIPTGVFVPVFTVGAAFGRMVGEGMTVWFPNGVKNGDVIHKIVPGGYAVVGAAALSGSVTRTISTAVIVFEVTGQISHVLPAVVAVLLSNAVANLFIPSFYDSIIRLKRLPFLPNIISSKVDSWNVYVEDIMIKDVKYVSFVSTYAELKELLEDTALRTYPLVDSKDSMVLLGSLKRFELERMLWVHLSEDQKIFLPPEEDEGVNSEMSSPGSSRATSPSPRVEIIPGTSAFKPRFQVTKVSETEKPAKKPIVPISRSASVTYNREGPLISMERGRRASHTLDLPLRSILKNSPQSSLNASTVSDFRVGINKHYRRLSLQITDSIAEDVPFTLNENTIQNLTKHVNLPPEPIKVKNLTADRYEAWEEDHLAKVIDWDGCQIDPAPFQLVERTSLYKVHSLFSLLGLNHAYVTNTGRLQGVVALKELRLAIQGHIDAEADKKKAGQIVEDEEDSDYEIEDPQNLVIEHPELPDHYKLQKSDTGYDIEEATHDLNEEEENQEDAHRA